MLGKQKCWDGRKLHNILLITTFIRVCKTNISRLITFKRECWESKRVEMAGLNLLENVFSIIYFCGFIEEKEEATVFFISSEDLEVKEW